MSDLPPVTHEEVAVYESMLARIHAIDPRHYGEAVTQQEQLHDWMFFCNFVQRLLADRKRDRELLADLEARLDAGVTDWGEDVYYGDSVLERKLSFTLDRLQYCEDLLRLLDEETHLELDRRLSEQGETRDAG